jgi:hypothetical protein
MSYPCNTTTSDNIPVLIGIDDVILAAVSGYPNKEVCSDIGRNGKTYSFEFMLSPPHSPPEKPALRSNHVGYLFSKHLKSTFDNDFERALQPSIWDLRSMYESGDHVRAFLATNGFGWAFRLFDFQDVSLAEFDWLAYGFIRTMRAKENLRHLSDLIPRRAALGILRRDERIIRFLANESNTIRTRMNQLQLIYGSIPHEILGDFLLTCASAVTVCEAFLRQDDLRSDQVFERHLVEAFNSLRQGDDESAFQDVLRFSLPSVQALAILEHGDAKLRKIKEISFHLDQLRLPQTPDTRKLNSHVAFLKNMLDSAYTLLICGTKKAKASQQHAVELDSLQTIPDDQYQARKTATNENSVFEGVKEFMAEAVQSYPNVVLGRIRRHSQASTRYSIVDFRVSPCDVMLVYSAPAQAGSGSGEKQSSETLVGRAISKPCCCENEMLVLLHPDTRTLNEMLRSGYGINAIAVTNGDRCLLRVHDSSNNTVLSAHRV